MSFDVYDLQCESGATFGSSAGLILDLVDVSATLYGLSVIVVVCRLYLRFRTRLWFWDDTLVLIAVVAMSLFIAGEYKIAFM